MEASREGHEEMVALLLSQGMSLLLNIKKTMYELEESGSQLGPRTNA